MAALVSLVACQSPTATSNASATAASATGRQESRLASGPSRDLSQDEAAGGHILRKHVGQTEDELRERLERERHITGASTYTDRPTAEHAVGAAIAQSQRQIESWLGRRAGTRTLCSTTTARSRLDEPSTVARTGRIPAPTRWWFKVCRAERVLRSDFLSGVPLMKTHNPKIDITTENFPALHTFLRGYFHEDVADEYGTAPEAADQFCEDADSDERIPVAREWQRVVDLMEGQPPL